MKYFLNRPLYERIASEEATKELHKLYSEGLERGIEARIKVGFNFRVQRIVELRGFKNESSTDSLEQPLVIDKLVVSR